MQKKKNRAEDVSISRDYCKNIMWTAQLCLQMHTHAYIYAHKHSAIVQYSYGRAIKWYKPRNGPKYKYRPKSKSSCVVCICIWDCWICKCTENSNALKARSTRTRTSEWKMHLVYDENICEIMKARRIHTHSQITPNKYRTTKIIVISYDCHRHTIRLLPKSDEMA